mgnify:CR=1 FL=1|uniref:Putative zinc-finger domain-containing protein n=1 Tax=Schlesneria paludicola TaxID=360056 RepID=A0A7C4LQ72_9PLAN
MTAARPDPSELLSAYFDGEVTPEERARVEQLRRDSATLDAELQALAELSQLVKSVPRAPAPPEIFATVMQVVERQTLLAPAPVQRSRGRLPIPWVRETVVFLTGVAATLLASFAWSGRFSATSREFGLLPGSVHSPSAEGAIPFAAPSAADRLAETVEKSSSVVEPGLPQGDGLQSASLAIRGAAAGAPAGVAGEASHVRAAQSPGLAVSATSRPVHRAEPESQPPGPKASDGQPVAEAAGTVTTPSVVDAKQAADAAVSTASVPFRDALELFAADPARGEQWIVNVDLYAADAERAADQLQQSLLENNVPPLPALATAQDRRRKDETTVAENAAAAAAASPEAASALANENPAVYVEAPAELVTLSLEQLAQRRELLGVRLRPPLELPPNVTIRKAVAREGQPGSGGNRSEGAIDVEQLILLYNHAVAARDVLDDEWHQLTDFAPADALLVQNAPAAAEEAQRASEVERRQAALPQRGVGSRKAVRGPTGQESIPNTGVQSALPPTESMGYNQLFKLPLATAAERSKLRAKEPPSTAWGERFSGAPQSLSDEARLRQNRFEAPLPGHVRVLFVIRETATDSAPPTTAPASPLPAGPAAPR